MRRPSHNCTPLFDSDAVTDNNIVFDQAVRADIAVLPNFGQRQYRSKLPDARAYTNRCGLNISQAMDCWWIHSDIENIPLKSVCQKGLSFFEKK